MNFNSPKKIFLIITGIIFLLFVLNVASYLHLIFNDLESSNVFFRKTNFNIERNIPTIFSSCLHFTAAILLGYVALSNLKISSSKNFWWFMSLVLLFTGLDELLVIHEKLGRSISESFDTSGLFFYSWVIPYIGGCLILGLLIIKPLLRLPKKTSLNFILGGFIFISGAVGIEMFTGWYVDNSSFNLSKLDVIPEIFILYTIEEFLEMFGMAYFIYALLKFLKIYTLPATNEEVITVNN